MEQLIAVSIPVVAILAVFGLGALKAWIAHREKLAELKLAQVERQAQLDRELLSMGGPTTQSAHLQVILDRLGQIEKRLDAAGAASEVTPQASLSIPAAPPLAPPEHEAPDRRRATETHDSQ